jgi:hypothetical protein
VSGGPERSPDEIEIEEENETTHREVNEGGTPRMGTHREAKEDHAYANVYHHPEEDIIGSRGRRVPIRGYPG